MAEGLIFKITEVEGGVIVTEFERGNQRSITIDDYVAQGNDIKELFTEYFTNNPDKASNLVFGDTDDPKTGCISYKNATIDVFEKKDLQGLISGEDQFLGLVSYKDILVNTQNLVPAEQDEPETSMSETLSGVTEDLKKSGLREFINKHKVLTGVVLGVLLIVALVIGISMTSTGGPPKIELTDDHVAKYFKEKEQFLKNFGKKFAGRPVDAKIQIQLFINELTKVKDKNKKLSEKQIATLDELLIKAEKYKVAIDKK